jgi:P-type Ca2+ transporter type 2C
MHLELKDAYQKDTASIIAAIGSRETGLSSAEAETALATFGPNEIAGAKKKSLLRKALESLLEPMVLILFVATGFSFLIKDYLEGAAILGVVLINTIIGLIQDGKAERAVEELKKMLSPQFRVLRDGVMEIIASRFIVPGDVIVFESGDIIPADVRLIEGKGTLVDEAHLTGESEPVEKNTNAIDKSGLMLYEMKNILFSGSKVLNGTGKALVVKTGSATEMGAIAHNIQSAEEEKTPLQRRLQIEIKFLVVLAVLSALFVAAVFFHKAGWNIDWTVAKDAILISITIMVAVFPEGLPASITIALSLAVERLAKNSVIVKKLSSVETLGNVDYICTDKTGTITQHNMTVKEFYLGEKILQHG